MSLPRTPRRSNLLFYPKPSGPTCRLGEHMQKMEELDKYYKKETLEANALDFREMPSANKTDEAKSEVHTCKFH